MVTTDYDSEGDVLYVRLPDAKIWHSREIDGDSWVILSFNQDDVVVGLIIMGIKSAFTPKDWVTHFNTGEIPEPLFKAVEEWLEANPV